MNYKRLKISQKKIVIFSVFVFVATIFWFLDALNREYTTKINYPIEFYNFPKDVLINSKYPNKLSVTLKAHGFDLIGKMNISNAVKVDVSKMAKKDKTDNQKLILSLKKVSANLFPDLTNAEIVNIEPEVVIFKAVKVSTKQVPVKLNIDFSTTDLYMQSGEITITPKNIEVSGQEKELKKIKYVETKTIKFENLDDTLKAKIQLKKIDNINFSENVVSIILPIEKFTENEVIVPVKNINCPDSVTMVTFPNEVNISYKVALSKYNFVNKNDFIIVANYKQVIGKKEKIHVEVKDYPKFIKSLKVNPEYLEYIIKKKE